MQKISYGLVSLRLAQENEKRWQKINARFSAVIVGFIVWMFLWA